MTKISMSQRLLEKASDQVTNRMAQLLKEMMAAYFEPEMPMRISRDLPPACQSDPADNSLPIQAVQQTEWRRVSDPNRLMREYEFANPHTYHNFLLEVIEFEHEFGHYAKLTGEYPNVIVEVYTHEVNDVTELDLEYASAVDQIRADIAYYKED